MKRVLGGVFSILCVLIAVVIIAPSFMDWSQYKGQIISQVKEHSGLDVQIEGTLGFTILPSPHLYIENASVLAAQGAKNDKAFTFDRFDIYVALFPLFQSQIAVQSVTLVRPELNFEVFKDGKYNVAVQKSTDEPSADQAVRQEVSQSKAPSFDIAIDKITIKDGSLSYVDHKSGAAYSVKNINSDISLSSLYGPYSAGGSLFYDGYSINFDIKAKEIDLAAKIISPTIDLSVLPINANLNFSGIVDYSDALSVQGLVKTNIDDLNAALNKSGGEAMFKNGIGADISGMLSYDTKKLLLDNIEASIGRQKIDITTAVQIKPLRADVSMKTQGNISPEDIISMKVPVKKLSFDLKMHTDGTRLDLDAAKFNADGQLVNISGQYGLQSKSFTSYITADIDSIRDLADKFQVDHKAWPEDVKSAKVKLKADGDMSALNITSNIDAAKMELIAKGRIINLSSQASIDNLAVQIKHPNTAKIVEMLTSAQLDKADFSGPLDLYANINQKGSTYALNDIKGNLSGTTLTGNAALELAVKPYIKGDIVLGVLKIGSATSAKASNTTTKSSTLQSNVPKERWSSAPINTAALHAVNMELDIKAKSIQYGAWPLQNPSLSLSLKDGDLNIKSLKSGIFGGQIDMNFVVDAPVKAGEAIRFKSASSFKNADIGKLSTTLLGTQLLKIAGSGDVEISLESFGASTNALVQALSGQGRVNGRDIVLDGVDVTRFARALSDKSKPGDSLVGLWKGTTSGGRSVFDTLDGIFTIKDGIVSLAKMDLDGVQSAIQTRGQIDLPKWTLATKHKIIVKGTEDAPSDVPEFEVSFNGSLDNPAQTFGQGLLQDYLNRKVQNKLNKMLSDKLGLPSNDNNAPAAQEKNTDGAVGDSAEKPKDDKPAKNNLDGLADEAIKGVLDGLFR